MLSFLPTSAVVYIATVIAVLGLVMGSALNCLSERLANGEKWSGGRSHCSACGHVLGVRDLVPVFSWLFLKGRCRYCGEKIPVRCPLTELTLAVCYIALLFKFDISLQFAVNIILVSCLFCLSLVDLETQIIPDRFLIIPAVCRITELLYEGGFSGLWQSLWPALVLGGGILILCLLMDKVLGRESMGGGDIKLLAMLGLWFNLPGCLLLLLVSCAVGLILAAIMIKLKPETPFPFGPAISIAAFICLLCGDFIITWYLNLFI